MCFIRKRRKHPIVKSRKHPIVKPRKHPIVKLSRLHGEKLYSSDAFKAAMAWKEKTYQEQQTAKEQQTAIDKAKRKWNEHDISPVTQVYTAFARVIAVAMSSFISEAIAA